MKPLITRDNVWETLRTLTGESNGVTASELVTLVLDHTSPLLERQLRRAIEDLRLEGKPICGLPGTGYFVAATPKELLAAVAFLWSRVKTGLLQISAMRGVPAPDIEAYLGLAPHSAAPTGLPPTFSPGDSHE